MDNLFEGVKLSKKTFGLFRKHILSFDYDLNLADLPVWLRPGSNITDT